MDKTQTTIIDENGIAKSFYKHYRNKELRVYDLEVFAYDWFGVFKNPTTGITSIYHSGPNHATLPNVIELDTRGSIMKLRSLVRNRTLISYNGAHYDDIVLSQMLRGESTMERNRMLVKKVNDAIINEEAIDLRSELNSHGAWSIDLAKEISGGNIIVSKKDGRKRRVPPSLKKIESQMGINIQESDVSFEIDRPLTPKEIDSVIEYCLHDVDATIQIFHREEKAYLQPKQVLLERIQKIYPNEYDYGRIVGYNVTVLMGIILLGNKKNNKFETWRFNPNDTSGEVSREFLWRQVQENGFPAEVAKAWCNAYLDPETGTVKLRDEDTIKGKIPVEAFGAKIIFAAGGVHGVSMAKKGRKKKRRHKRVKMLDVASLYPWIMILLKILGMSTNKFLSIVEERLRAKHSGDKSMAGGLKLGINKVYGCLASRYSNLYNPWGGFSVCIYGQIALFDLCRRLSIIPDLELVNINTDGVGFTCPDEFDDTWKEIWREWEEEWKLSLELETFKELYQKDVNNYIGVHYPDNEGNVEMKLKGGQVNRAQYASLYQDDNNRIVHRCIVEAIINNAHPIKTIQANADDVSLFMNTCNTGHTFDHTEDELGNIIPLKINRVFAVREEFKQHSGLFKVRIDGTRSSFPKMPQHLIIHNDDLKEMHNFAEQIDMNYYSDLACHNLRQWGIDPESLEY